MRTAKQQIDGDERLDNLALLLERNAIIIENYKNGVYDGVSINGDLAEDDGVNIKENQSFL